MPFPNGILDLRSDTVTLPLPEMYAAMQRAPLGDDVYDDDPTVNALQELGAALTGHAAGLFVPSGTMGNLAALLAHCGRGDEAILGSASHIFWDEAGGLSTLGAIMAHTVPNQPDGALPLEAIAAAIRPDDVHMPRTRLVCLENTQNACGGAPLTAAYTRAVASLAHARGLKLHVDGARLFNAAAALGVPAADLAAPADSVTFCLSKGLCAPVGSLLCGPKGFIAEAKRARKVLGGGMRQAGLLAAAGIVALEVMPARLVEDHRRAAQLAEKLAQIEGISLLHGAPPTNMVYLRLADDFPATDAEITARLAQQGIVVISFEARIFRLVTHYWVDDADVQRVVGAFVRLRKG